jgi:hypothetical protein
MMGKERLDIRRLAVECGRIQCVANHGKKCVMPSRIKIGSNGKCLGEQT